MSFDLARPRYTLPFAGKDYELLGTFGMIEAVEFAMKEYVGDVALRVIRDMSSTDLAKLVSTILTANGAKMTAEETKALLWDVVGLKGNDNDLLRIHLWNFFDICLSPPGEREKAANTAKERLGKLDAASPGSTTDASA
jgi:hypothetical protein